ncbi:MAG: hypothetical protein E2O95_02195 [Acidobacteria bacterium]|nr:MAG: hypothetical protein E2O95_02195 [Acidobacteriota bacterium]
MSISKFLITLLVTFALVGAACTGTPDAASATTTSTSTTVARAIPDLEFGRGEVPFTVPELFPIPDTAVIGSTMIDGVNGRTEMIVTFPAKVGDIVDYYETNLPVLGFDVTSSRGTEFEWDIVLEIDGTTGTIHIVLAGESLSTGTLLFVSS